MMSRRPAPVSYAASLTVEQQPIATAIGSNKAPDLSDILQQGRGRRPLEDAADPRVLYLHPAGKKTLRLYAVERGVKVHDLLNPVLHSPALSRPSKVPLQPRRSFDDGAVRAARSQNPCLLLPLSYDAVAGVPIDRMAQARYGRRA